MTIKDFVESLPVETSFEEAHSLALEKFPFKLASYGYVRRLMKARKEKFRVFYERIDYDIKTHGRQCMGVFAGLSTPAFCYTIGNHLKGLPEILTIGSTKVLPLLNLWSEKMIERGKPFENGELIDIGGACPCMAIVCTDMGVRDEYLIQAGQYFGHEDYSVIQILLPDKNGKFGPDAEAPYGEAPIYGEIPYEKLRA